MIPLALSALGVPLWPLAKDIRQKELECRIKLSIRFPMGLPDSVKSGRGARFTGGKR